MNFYKINNKFGENKLKGRCFCQSRNLTRKNRNVLSKVYCEENSLITRQVYLQTFAVDIRHGVVRCRLFFAIFSPVTLLP